MIAVFPLYKGNHDMKILVIGGCGYIGSVLVEILVSRNYSVHVIDNLRYSQKPLVDLCHFRNFDITVGDFRNKDLMSAMLPKFDVIIPLAAIVGLHSCDADPYATISTNVDAVCSMLKMLSRDQIIVYPCTNSGYGSGDSNIIFTEKSPLNPVSLYGRTKVDSERAIMERENSISLRLATVFGGSPCMRTDLLVNNFVLRALKDSVVVLFESHFKRNYIHVRDAAKAIIMSMEKFNVMKSNIYNAGLSDANFSKLELCKRIKQYIDFDVLEHNESSDPDQRNYIVSNDKIEKHGFSPDFSIDDGIQEVIKCYKISKACYYDV